MDEVGESLEWHYFSQKVVTAYEETCGEEPMAYRDPRGIFYHPHTGESLPLGTLAVEKYRRPEYQFNKVLVVEKEGFFEALKAVNWPERHDCALLATKGQPTRAARDLVDMIADTKEPVQVFVLHDCDAPGTIYMQSFQEETRLRGRRSIELIDLGLNIDEALELAEQGIIEIEDHTYEKHQAVADYVDDEDKRDWFQTHRAELNAFTTAQFIDRLDRLMAKYDGKLVPPNDVLIESLNRAVDELVRDKVTRELLAESRLEDRVQAARAELEPAVAQLKSELPERIAADLEADRLRDWRYVLEARAVEVVTDGKPPDAARAVEFPAV
jgi:hypothetical protein